MKLNLRARAFDSSKKTLIAIEKMSHQRQPRVTFTRTFNFFSPQSIILSHDCRSYVIKFENVPWGAVPCSQLKSRLLGEVTAKQRTKRNVFLLLLFSLLNVKCFQLQHHGREQCATVYWVNGWITARTSWKSSRFAQARDENFLSHLMMVMISASRWPTEPSRWSFSWIDLVRVDWAINFKHQAAANRRQ